MYGIKLDIKSYCESLYQICITLVSQRIECEALKPQECVIL